MRQGVVGLVTQGERLTYKERAPMRAFFFFSEVNVACPNSLPKNKRRVIYNCLWWPKKWDSCFFNLKIYFQSIFLPKTPMKHP